MPQRPGKHDQEDDRNQQQIRLQDGKVAEYQVNLKITFVLEG